jgi:hypothetical protein
MKETKKLPKRIEQDLNRNTTFNMFGLVNLSALRARTGTRLKDEDLKERIQNRFGHEMATGSVEFMGEKK